MQTSKASAVINFDVSLMPHMLWNAITSQDNVVLAKAL
jgi:hypothetical protein